MILSSSTGIGFVYVTDREKGVRFYRDALGLKHVEADDFGDGFDLNGSVLRLTAMAEHKAGEHPVVGWLVADMSVAVQGLKAEGVRCVVYEGMGQDADGVWTAPGGRTKLAWFKDPDGNVLMLSEG